MTDPNERDPIDFVPFGDQPSRLWWGDGSEPYMLPCHLVPARSTDGDTPRVVVNITHHVEPDDSDRCPICDGTGLMYDYDNDIADYPCDFCDGRGWLE